MTLLEETSRMVSMDSIPGFFDSHTHEHPFPSHLATLGSPIKQASKVPATCLTLTTLPMPHTHLSPTQTSNLPALHPAVFDQPTSQPESPPIIIKVIKQLPSQAYTNVLTNQNATVTSGTKSCASSLKDVDLMTMLLASLFAQAPLGEHLSVG